MACSTLTLKKRSFSWILNIDAYEKHHFIDILKLNTYEKGHLVPLSNYHDAFKKHYILSFEIVICLKLKCPNYALFYKFPQTINSIIKN